MLNQLYYLMWWATPVIMSLVVVSMYRRQLHRQFPVFFNYAILQVIIFALEFSLRHWSNIYYVSWTMTVLSIAVAFAVLFEIFKEAFRPYDALRDLSVILFRWCAVVVLLVAAMWAVTSWKASNPDNMTAVMLLGTRCVRMMQCGLVFFLLLFSEYLGISRRNVVFGIAVGFGFFASVNMLVMLALSHSTALSRHTLNRINFVAYIVSMLVWLAYAALPTTVRSKTSKQVGASQKWDSALDDVRNAPVEVSLLDTMDQTVERLLYRSGSEAGATVTHHR
jgi:hypothetical protein